eukprot:Skav219639  [mRNA]  locus=scaffold628:287867:298463:- [translate_table: standard]
MPQELLRRGKVNEASIVLGAQTNDSNLFLFRSHTKARHGATKASSEAYTGNANCTAVPNFHLPYLGAAHQDEVTFVLGQPNFMEDGSCCGVWGLTTPDCPHLERCEACYAPRFGDGYRAYFNDKEWAFARRVGSFWTNVAASGDPNCRDASNSSVCGPRSWPTFPDGEVTQQLGPHKSTAQSFEQRNIVLNASLPGGSMAEATPHGRPEICAFWDAVEEAKRPSAVGTEPRKALYVSPLADPLIADKLLDRALKLLKKAISEKQTRRGVPECTKAMRKGQKGICFLALALDKWAPSDDNHDAMGCGSSLAKRNAAADDRVGNYIVEDDHLGRKCGKCEGLCILKISESGACALCGADSAGAWCCRAGCGFLVCVLCELHLAMMGDSVHRLRVALLAFKDLDSASTREAMAILEAFAALEAATETDEVQQLQSALAVQHKVAELAAVLEEWEAVKLRLENVMAAIAIALAEEQPVALDELRTCIAAAREARSSPELNEALGRAEPLLEKQRSREFRDACCYGCYAESRAKALHPVHRATCRMQPTNITNTIPYHPISIHSSLVPLQQKVSLEELLWYRCDLCDFDLCHHCLQWRAKSDADKSSLPEQDPAIREGRAETSTFSRVETQRLRLGRLANEQSQRDWFNEWAAKNSAINAQWELFRGGCWVPCGRGLTNWLAEALQSGVKQALYTAMNHQEHLFDFKQMEQVIVSSGKRRPMRRVLWEVELDIGWFQVEDDLALRLRTQESCGASSFKYSARDMQYTIDIKEMEQVNENLGTRRKLRKVAVGEAPPKMSRHQLRMALEDDFRDFAYSTRQWLALRWPWQVLGDCSIDADGFIETGLADDIASGLDTLQREMPQLGSIMQNIIWFDYVDGDKKGSLSAEDACSALWAELCLKGGIEKLEFLVAGGLAEELLEILNSDIESVDDWIMEKRLPLWEGQDCAVCFCPIGKGDVGRRMRCSCWLHFECLGRGLGVKISEKAVDDEQMSICPACNTDLGRIIPPGVVHRAVGDDIFARPRQGQTMGIDLDGLGVLSDHNGDAKR